jgi:hypothetical protein
MPITGSRKRSISVFAYDTVDSIIGMPMTGKLMVGIWKQ